jgi:hypothetical protein
MSTRISGTHDRIYSHLLYGMRRSDPDLDSVVEANADYCNMVPLSQRPQQTRGYSALPYGDRDDGMGAAKAWITTRILAKRF